MCTRYFMDDAPKWLAEEFAYALSSSLADKFIKHFGKPVITRGEIRPTDITPVFAPNRNGTRAIYPMKWGFTNPNHNSTIFNARTESAGVKSTFKSAWKSHRCAIPASYYFEWEHFKNANGKEKTGDKYLIQPKGADITWLCGLYRIENGFPTFVVLTKEPCEELRFIHDRMPLILPDDVIDEWLKPDTNPDDLLSYAVNDMIYEKASLPPLSSPSNASVKS